MLKLTQAIFAVMVTSMLSLAAHDKVSVQGGGTMINNNSISGGYNANVTRFNIVAEGDTIEKGKFRVSSFEAGPIDPVTGIDFEANGPVDAVRVFADHPDIVWCHGYVKGSIVIGTSPAYGALAGTTTILNSTNGEYIGAVSTYGRTNFVTVFEALPNALPDFFSATEDELIEFVGGFSRVLLTTGAEPGKICIETKGGNVTIPRP